MFSRVITRILCFSLMLSITGAGFVAAQTQTAGSTDKPTISRYLDQIAGMTDDEAVRIALENNGELQALRKEVEASLSLVKQARLRPNPKLELSGARQLGGADNNQVAEVMLPLELGGRRAARIAVAQRELEAREFEFANQERL